MCKIAEPPKVTVVTVTYNAEKYLERTIKSVVEQDYPHVEYIIIDGASTDSTLDIIKKYEKYINYWISEPDSGIYDAMNKGIDIATGEWINFMNAGDSFCEKTTILKTMSMVEKNTDIIVGDIYYLEDNKKTYRAARGLNQKFNGMFCCHQAVFTKTYLMKRYKFNTIFNIVADYDFILKCAVNNHKFQFVNFEIANYLGGGFYDSNKVYANIENIFLQSHYIKDKNEIFNLSSFQYLKKVDMSSQNYAFTYFTNSFYQWIDTLDLSKAYLLYGYGTIGKLIYDKIEPSIITIVDANSKNLSTVDRPIYTPEIINNFKFDYIIISVLGREDEIIRYLDTLNISSSKILTFDISH